MTKTYRLVQNHIIIINEDGFETDITEQGLECDYCKESLPGCGGTGPALCDRFKCKYLEACK